VGRIEIRKAQNDDVPAIRSVAQTAWDHTYRDSTPERVREVFLSHAYSADSLRLRMGLNVFLAALEDSNIVEFADFRPLSQTEVELGAIYVLPEMPSQGAGVASWQSASPALQPGHGSRCTRSGTTCPPNASTRPAGFEGRTSLRNNSSDTSFSTSRCRSTPDLSHLVGGSPAPDRRFLQHLATI
jgi:hypothetical protein